MRCRSLVPFLELQSLFPKFFFSNYCFPREGWADAREGMWEEEGGGGGAHALASCTQWLAGASRATADPSAFLLSGRIAKRLAREGNARACVLTLTD